ncbi:hypothetical protein N326_02786, partial [Eurypyga helias]
KNPFEETKPCNNAKRALQQDEEELQLPSPKKLKRNKSVGGEASQDLQVS